MQTCVECGASAEASCAELFEHLLALDHSRTEPWGSLHGVAVACYRLQHPSASTGGGQHILLDLLRAYRGGGLAAAQWWEEAARRANSHRRSGQPHPLHPSKASQEQQAPAMSGNGFAVTIADVSRDGTFPAEGYSARLDSWVEATLAAWLT